MSKKKAREATENPQKQIELSYGNILGKLFWTIIDRSNTTYGLWDRYMNKFVNDPRNVPEQTPDRRSERRSNLMAALTRYDRLTWNRFLDGLKSAGFNEFELVIRAKRSNGREAVEVKLMTELADLDTNQETTKEDKDE